MNTTDAMAVVVGEMNEALKRVEQAVRAKNSAARAWRIEEALGIMGYARAACLQDGSFLFNARPGMETVCHAIVGAMNEARFVEYSDVTRSQTLELLGYVKAVYVLASDSFRRATKYQEMV